MSNGDRIGLCYTNTDFARYVANNMQMQEYQMTYAKKLSKNMYLDAVAGYAKAENVDNVKRLSKGTKMVGLGLHWEY